MAKFLSLKKEMQRDLRQPHWMYTEKEVTPDEDNTQPFACLKRFCKFIKHQGVASLKVYGKHITEPLKKAEVMNAN